MKKRMVIHPLFPWLFLNFHSTGRAIFFVKSMIGPSATFCFRIWWPVPFFLFHFVLINCIFLCISLYVLYSASCYGTLYVYFCAYRAPNQTLALPQPNLLLNCIVVGVVVAFCYFAARHFCEFANFFSLFASSSFSSLLSCFQCSFVAVVDERERESTTFIRCML